MANCTISVLYNIMILGYVDMASNFLNQQLRDICRLIGASWAALLELRNSWNLIAIINAHRVQHIELSNFLKSNFTEKWLNRALADNRNLSLSAKNRWINLNCKKIYIFPNTRTQTAVLVGADELSTVEKRSLKNFFTNYSSPGFNDSSHIENPQDLIPSIPLHSPDALNQCLDLVMKSMGSLRGWLAIRSGEYLEIMADSHNLEIRDKRIPIDSNPLLREVMQERSFRIVAEGEIEWKMVPRTGFSSEEKIWAACPLIIGRRNIGLIGLWLKHPPSPVKSENTRRIVRKITPGVEGSILFDDLSNQVRRMALLNDFSVTISSAADVEQIVKRSFTLIQRTFETNRVVLVIQSSGDSYFHRYFFDNGVVNFQVSALNKGDQKDDVSVVSLRVDSISGTQQYRPNYQDSSSALIVPLKYRRQVIGSICLESTKEAGFSRNDESLLAIIASHLAGLLENGRLRQEAESRALNLSLIHSVVEHVIGLTDVEQVAQISAELIARNFTYELTCVALLNSDNNLRLVGVGGSAASTVKSFLLGNETKYRQGIVGQVLVNGESICANDVNKDPVYLPIPGWEAGSEMCIPLKDGNTILGIIDVESKRTNAFTVNEVLVLESLAGILASVISNTGQYQKLQTTISQLQTTRRELQERISAQRMAESRLVQAAKLAAVGEMAAGIAHELNNPLTTVAGFTELTLDGLPKNIPVRTDLELVLREAQRARDVVRRLLDFARQSESVRTRCDINELITDVIYLTQHLLHTNGILVKTKLAEKIPWVLIDQNQIKQVILNLIHNSLYAMPTGGSLSISTYKGKHEDREGVVIVIKDSGVGIPPDKLDKIFEPFFTTRSHEGGTGLGLSVSYGIVTDHGGEIRVESREGIGSAFTVWLPK